MKIVISSDNAKGTTVSSESGRELYQTDSAFELSLYCEGIKKEFPEAEFVFHSNLARGAIYEAGKTDGKNLKQENEKYQTVCNFGGLTSISGCLNLRDAVAANEKNVSDPEIPDCIIIDRPNKIVEITKGSIDPFKKGLDKKIPGWKVGEIKR